MTDRVGQQLGNYRLTRLLGRGGQAEVYLAEHLHLKASVAVKVLYGQFTTQDVQMFLHEAQTIAQLRHPHILRVSDFGFEQALPFLAMDYAPGGTLRDRYPHGSTVSLPTVISYTKQIAAALAYAHAQKLIHRDIKPENMLIDADGNVLLGDFGIVARAHSTASMKTLDNTGTVHYMAPEQINGKPCLASDQYALAIVVYEWLTGKRPFAGESPIEIAMKHLSNDPPTLRAQGASISSDVEQTILKALAKDPRQRFPTIQGFAIALQQASEGNAAAYATTIIKKTQSRKNLITTLLAKTQRANVIEKTQKASTTQPVRVATREGKTKEQWVVEAGAQRKRHQFEEALKACNHALKLDPNYADAYASRGTTYGLLKKDHLALDNFDRAIKLAPENANAYCRRGGFYINRKKYDLALLDLEYAMELDPTDDLPYVNRGALYAGRQEYKKALADFDYAIELNPDCDEAYTHRGLVYWSVFGEYNKALADFECAINLDPSLAENYRYRGVVYNRIGKRRTAIDEFSQAIKLDSDDAFAYLYRGDVYSSLDQYEKAIQDYDHALALYFKDKNVRFTKELERDIRSSKGTAEVLSAHLKVMNTPGLTEQQFRQEIGKIANIMERNRRFRNQ